LFSFSVAKQKAAGERKSFRHFSISLKCQSPTGLPNAPPFGHFTPWFSVLSPRRAFRGSLLGLWAHVCWPQLVFSSLFWVAKLWHMAHWGRRRKILIQKKNCSMGKICTMHCYRTIILVFVLSLSFLLFFCVLGVSFIAPT